MKTLALLLLFFIHLPPVHANDSAAATGAGGIHFQKTAGIVMEKEELFISLDQVKVSYIFKNITGKDITVNIFFPLPPQMEISAQTSWDKEVREEMGVDQKEIPFENFSVLVNGQKIPFKTEIRALQNGQDITQVFHKNKLPLSPLLATCAYPMAEEAANKACEDRMAQYKNLGLLSASGKPLWQKQTHYHWPQTFPKGQIVKIEHSYRPARGSFFFEVTSERPPMESMLEQLLPRGAWIKQFCPWETLPLKENFIPWLIQQFQNASKSKKTSILIFYEVDYILTTGANWEGPIRDFTLTVEYPKGGTLASCWPFNQQDIKVVGDNRIQIHEKNFTPWKDLKILFGSALTKF
jgi:hypothetical protein